MDGSAYEQGASSTAQSKCTSSCDSAPRNSTSEQSFAPQPHRRRLRQFLGFGSTQATLLAAALFAACLAGPQLAEAAKCTRYRGSGCHFTVRHNEPVLFPACLSNCRFEVEQEMECPFYSAGLFLENEVDGECEDEFMSIAPRSLPGCDKHCCTLQHSSGAFLPKGTETRKDQLQYQPGGSNACRFSQYTRDEILTALQGGNGEGEHPGMDILVLGDSLMRQLYSRLVHMLRGHHRVFDYKMHTHAAYSICKEADAFKTAPYNGNRSALAGRIDDQYLTDIVPSFFASASNVEPGLLCSKPAVAINYAHAPQWSDQAAALERYWPSATTEGRLPVVVLSVGFWEKTSEVPEEYLQMLTELLAKVERIFFVGLPTSRVQHEEWATAYTARNAAMKAWAKKAGPKAEFLDFDILAHVPGGPPAGADGNWHYSCFLQWPSWRNKKLESQPGNYFRDRLYGHPIEGLVMTEDGSCGDEMNRNLWQMVFNVLLGNKGVPKHSLSAGRATRSEHDHRGGGGHSRAGRHAEVPDSSAAENVEGGAASSEIADSEHSSVSSEDAGSSGSSEEAGADSTDGGDSEGEGSEGSQGTAGRSGGRRHGPAGQGERRR
mmetsp:Transcript_4695/g.13492  ORF Transcript_4695/g.13492 Transcript_4695/m.13492 type:complete len:605 (-) Transcript_4695:890-2704(-)